MPAFVIDENLPASFVDMASEQHSRSHALRGNVCRTVFRPYARLELYLPRHRAPGS